MRPSDPDGAGLDGARAANVLGKVADPGALDDERGPCGQIDLSVPASWSGRRVRVDVPRRVVCARCGGGGCDRCGRSGALVLRASADGVEASSPRGPSFEMQLPPVGAKPVLVRVPRPFGDGAGVDLLHVVVESGPADPRVTLVDGAPPAANARGWIAVGVVLVIAVVAALRQLG